MDRNPSSSKPDRKTVEKNRRTQMKSMCSKLSALVPPQSNKGAVSQLDQLEVATNYIKKLELKLEKIKQKKNWLLGLSSGGGLKRPIQLNVNCMGCVVEVILITATNCHFLFRETIRMLQEEDAEIANASFSVQENAVFHTIHCKIGGSAPELGATRIVERLRNFVALFDP